MLYFQNCSFRLLEICLHLNWPINNNLAMTMENRTLRNLKALQTLLQKTVQSSLKKQRETIGISGLQQEQCYLEDVIPEAINISSFNFVQIFQKQYALIQKTPMLEVKDLQHLFLIEFSKTFLYNDRQLKNLVFRRNIQTQKLEHLSRTESVQSEFLQWPSFQKFQRIELALPNKNPELPQITLQISKEDLLFLKQNKVITEKIITNFFYLLSQANMLAERVQIAPFHFMARLLNGVSFDEQSEEVIKGMVSKNCLKASKCLKCQIYLNQYTAIPFLMNGHHSMFIVKGMFPDRLQKEHKIGIVYCSSRELAKKGLFFAIKQYLQMQANRFGQQQVKLDESSFYCTQILLPKQVSARDSGLFLMRYVQLLLGNGNTQQISQVRSDCLNSKLHIFPVNVVYEMRPLLWNFYCKMLQMGNKANKSAKYSTKLKIMEQYFKQVKACEARANLQRDYAKLEMRQMGKLSLLENQGCLKNEGSLNRFALEYFYRPEINYYSQ